MYDQPNWGKWKDILNDVVSFLDFDRRDAMRAVQCYKSYSLRKLDFILIDFRQNVLRLRESYTMIVLIPQLPVRSSLPSEFLSETILISSFKWMLIF